MSIQQAARVKLAKSGMNGCKVDCELHLRSYTNLLHQYDVVRGVLPQHAVVIFYTKKSWHVTLNHELSISTGAAHVLTL